MDYKIKIEKIDTYTTKYQAKIVAETNQKTYDPKLDRTVTLTTTPQLKQHITHIWDHHPNGKTINQFNNPQSAQQAAWYMFYTDPQYTHNDTLNGKPNLP